MTAYLIKCMGCDDTTRVRMELTPEQAATVGQLADAITAAGGGCRPVMTVTPWAKADSYDVDGLLDLDGTQ